MTARRIAGILVLAALTGYLVAFFAWPAPIVDQDVAVPLVVEDSSDVAQATLTAQGFRVKVLEARESDPLLPAGMVTWQDPPAGTRLPAGAVVTLTLSAGPSPVAVPDLAQFTREEAERVMAAAGLAIGQVDSVPSAAERGVVVLTRPGAGTPRAAGRTVDLVVSRGPADVRVPALAGLGETEARERLTRLGLVIGLIEPRRSGRGRAGTVLEQRPEAGTRVAAGSRVDLILVAWEP